MAHALRVFIDSNILISGLCFEGALRRLLAAAGDDRIVLVLAEYVLLETAAVITKKMPDRENDLRDFLSAIPYETIPLPSKKMVDRHRQYVSHDEDAPVLASAVLADAEYVVTGDKQLANRAVGEMVELISCAELLLRLEPK